MLPCTTAILTSLYAARNVHRSIRLKTYLQEGEAAFKEKDWQNACWNLGQYLSTNPDDIEILKKYANSAFSIRPLNANTIMGTISAYRRVIQLDPLDDRAYKNLASLYIGIGNFELKFKGNEFYQ